MEIVDVGTSDFFEDLVKIQQGGFISRNLEASQAHNRKGLSHVADGLGVKPMMNTSELPEIQQGGPHIKKPGSLTSS